jgi:DNA-binding response OmpR family regulator
MAPQHWISRDGKRLSVLLLEDDEQLAATLRSFLESNSCRVTHVESGVEGLRRIMDADFDLVLCDMVMPTFPGDKFYLAVNRVKPALCRRFLFMTGHRAEPKYEAFIGETGGVMLWKPFGTDELRDAIQTVLRRANELDVAEWSKALSDSRGLPDSSPPPGPVPGS